MEVNVMYTGNTYFEKTEISPRINIPLVLEFDEELTEMCIRDSINDRGILIDLDMAGNAISFDEVYTEEMTAVSYTHLDVYKRQARNIGEAYLEKAINHLKALRLLTPGTEYKESPTRKIIIGRNKL